MQKRGTGRDRAVAAVLTVAVGSALPLASACQSAKETASAPPVDPQRYLRPVAAWDASSRPVSEQIGAVRPPADGTGPEMVSRLRLSGAGGSEGVEAEVLTPDAGPMIPVKLALRDAAVAEVVRVLVGEYLERDYVLDPGVKQSTVTLDVDQDMSPGEVMDLLGGLAMVYGWSIGEREGVLYIRPAVDGARFDTAPIMQARAALDSDTVGVRVRTLRHAAAQEITQAVSPLMSEGAQVIAVGRTLVLVDTIRQLNRVAGLISALDVAPFDGAELITYRLAHREPGQAVQTLNALVTQTRLTRGGEPAVQFFALPGTTRVMAIARDASLEPTITAFMRQVDQPSDRAERGRYLYRAQHMAAADMKTLIDALFDDRQGDPVAPRVIPVEADGDSLLVLATPEDYVRILETLRVVDGAPQQVLLEATIIEVGLNESLEFGVDYFLRALDEDGLGILELTGALTGPASPAGTAFFVGGDGFAIATALQTFGDVQIRSHPKLFLAEGAQGEFQVGGEVPIVTADVDTQTQTDGTTGIRRSIEYRDTGLIFKAQPKINESGEIVLNVELEITDVGTQTELGPEFTTRKVINPRVVIPHGYTLLLSGIMRDEVRDNSRQIPILGDIPVIGGAFRSVDDSKARVEILLAITPTIVNDPRVAGGIVSEFVRASTGVRRALLDLADDPEGGAVIRAERFRPVSEAPRLEPEAIEPGEDGAAAEDTGGEVEAEDEAGAGAPEMPPILRALLGGSPPREQEGDGQE